MDILTARPPDAFAARHPRLLRQLREVLAKYPVKAAYLFGSYARGDERPDSDLDVYVEIDRSRGRFGWSQHYHLIQDLESSTNAEVDLVTRMDGRLLLYAHDDLTLVYTRV